MRRPRVCMLLATDIIGGPGNLLVQFLRCGGLERCEPLVVGYDYGTPGETEFSRAVRATGARMVTLRQRWMLDPALVPQALRVVRHERCEVLESHGYKSHAVCACLHLVTGLPWVAFVHGWTAENMKIRAYRALEHAVLPLATRVVAVSEALGRSLLPLARRRMRVIPNAVDAMGTGGGDASRDVRVEYGISPDAVVVGVVGRLSPEKGQVHLLRALAVARKRDSRLHALLLGDGQDGPMLKDEAARLGLDGAVTFTGHVSGTGDFYRAMDIVAMPSLCEGMPVAALEGMLHGLPLVASNVGGVPEVVVDGETGILVPAADEGRLAQGLLELARDPVARSRMGDAGSSRVARHFGPERRGEEIVGMYLELLGNSEQGDSGHAQLG
ncbi:glycosyltransferase family 4 protein [Nitratidesulfovibrio sp.]|uniref:glycosyltransferase family 4 protein n=1 Tax=Nitratidesulfovibrio sp. TaxID=2802297 RepID=UPI0033428577